MTDGEWIEWAGGECPVAPDTMVNWRTEASRDDTVARRAERLVWSWAGCSYDITAYRVVSQ